MHIHLHLRTYTHTYKLVPHVQSMGVSALILTNADGIIKFDVSLAAIDLKQMLHSLLDERVKTCKSDIAPVLQCQPAGLSCTSQPKSHTERKRRTHRLSSEIEEWFLTSVSRRFQKNEKNKKENK